MSCHVNGLDKILNASPDFVSFRIISYHFVEGDVSTLTGPLGGHRSWCRPRAASAAGHAAHGRGGGQQRRTPGGVERPERVRETKHGEAEQQGFRFFFFKKFVRLIHLFGNMAPRGSADHPAIGQR